MIAPGDASFADLVARAIGGDEAAWRSLYHRLKNVAWKTIIGFGLPDADANDAFAAVFFRLSEHLDRIRDPERLPGWVATTARNEVYAIMRSRRPTDELDGVDPPAVEAPVDRALLLDELQQAVAAAMARLSAPCRRLLQILTADPPLSYADIAEVLGMPIGSIGPTRSRCLDHLRSMPELQPYLKDGVS